jgi:hypothetical protein
MPLKRVRIIVSYLIFNKKLNLLIYLIGESEASSQPSQSTINSLFNKKSGLKEESFTTCHLNKLLLNFIINNNISFRAIITLSFIKLISYLNK